ncbi:hypothetical protein pb186bvf_000163 [Paramecium bursaria]
MSQLFHFKFILVHLEMASRQEFQQIEIAVQIKKGILQSLIRGAQKQNVCNLVKIPEKLPGMIRIPLNFTYEMQAKLQMKDGEYSDQWIKLLFYVQNALIGDCQLNISSFVHQNDQKIKRPLTSTNDKKAAIYFRIVINDSSTFSQEIPSLLIASPTEEPKAMKIVQTARNGVRDSSVSKAFRPRSTSPQRPFNFQNKEQVKQEAKNNHDPQKEGLVLKFQELGNKFEQQKQLQQQQQIDTDEIEAIITKQEEELQTQISEIDNQLKQQSSDMLKSSEKFTKDDKDQFNQQIQQIQQNADKRIESIQNELIATKQQNQHLISIIRQQGEQITKLKSSQQNSPTQSIQMSQHFDNLDQSQIIQTKNKQIQDLYSQIIDQDNNLMIIQNLKQEIQSLKQTIEQKDNQIRQKDQMYQEKLLRLLNPN